MAPVEHIRMVGGTAGLPAAAPAPTAAARSSARTSGTPVTAPASVAGFGAEGPRLSWQHAYEIAARITHWHDAIVVALTKPTRVPVGALPSDAGPSARALLADALFAVRRKEATGEEPVRLDALA